MPCLNFGHFPCGKCEGCLSKRSSDWAVRLSHELKSHDASSFITATYAVDPVSVSKLHAQLFLKRLRYYLEPKKIRFYLASEYGDKSKRPHYHAIIFGHDFSHDEGAYQVRAGLWSSPVLEKAWGLGHVSSGTVTDASIRYVTNYILGKQTVPAGCEKTFALMSRGGKSKDGTRTYGLGSAWIDSHQAETYRTDSVVAGGFERKPPRYYDLRTTAGSESAKGALRDRRRAVAVGVMQKDQADYLRNIHPDRKIAEGKIWLSRKSMHQGEL